MRDFEQVLNERADEVATHLAFIQSLEAAATGRGSGEGIPRIEAEPINILKSGFLVHLYNVVEAVMSKVLEEIEVCAKVHPPRTWCDGLLNEWAKGRMNLKRDLTILQAEGRVFDLLKETADREVVESVPIRRKGGNWSNEQIEALAEAVSCDLQIRQNIRFEACDEPFENDLPPLRYIRAKRNRLAHGSESFVDGAKHIPAERLELLREPVVEYMRDVVGSFSTYLDQNRFLIATVG